MTYWSDIMQDDAYLIASNGWVAEIRTIINKKGKTTGWDCDLIPKSLVINKYLTKPRDALDVIQTQLESINQQMQTVEEEHHGEEDMFSEARSPTGKITKGEIKKRIYKIKKDPDYSEELKVLKEFQELIDKQTRLKKEIKISKNELDTNLLIKYRQLTEPEIKALVVEDKWMTSVHTLVDGEMERISNKLAGRITDLMDRYQIPLPKLAENVQTLANKVDGHLEKMGYKW